MHNFGAREKIALPWILKNYPQKAPYVYVCPTNKMKIWNSSQVSQTGKINIPYLSNWNYGYSNIKVNMITNKYIDIVQIEQVNQVNFVYCKE